MPKAHQLTVIAGCTGASTCHSRRTKLPASPVIPTITVCINSASTSSSTDAVVGVKYPPVALLVIAHRLQSSHSSPVTTTPVTKRLDMLNNITLATPHQHVCIISSCSRAVNNLVFIPDRYK